MTKKKRTKLVDFGHYQMTDRMYLREVFYWFDGPQLFTAEYQHPDYGKIYVLGLAIADGKIIYVTMSRNRCRNVENNVTSIRQAMMFPDGKSFCREMLPRCFLISQYFIAADFEDDINKWQLIARRDVIDNEWIFIGGFKWHLTASERRNKRRRK